MQKHDKQLQDVQSLATPNAAIVMPLRYKYQGVPIPVPIANLRKKGSATVVWIIFPKVYFYKKLNYMQNFGFFLCYI
jgi:hypothetical protein